MACKVYDEIDTAGCFPGRVSSREVPVREKYSWPKKWLIEILRLTYQRNILYENFGHRLCAVARSSIAGVGFSPDGRRHIRVEEDRILDAMVLLKDGMRYITEKHIKFDAQQFLAIKIYIKSIKGKTLADIRLGLDIIGKSLGRLPFVTKKGHLVVSSE